MKKSAFTVYLSLVVFSLYSQPFQNSNVPAQGVWNGQSAFGDLDNDGDLDLIVSGSENYFYHYTRLYRNNGSGAFTEVTQKLPGIEYGNVDLDDFDQDGLLDILLVGSVDASSGKGPRLFRNKGNVNFQEVTTGLPSLNQGMGRFGDYDNDGDPDILLAGSDLFDQYHDVFRNDKGVFSSLGLKVPKYTTPALSWGDYDQDADLDYIIAGSGTVPTTIYKNQGSDAFLPVSLNQPALTDASVEWGDFNSDGKLDILMMGYEQESASDVFYVLENKGDDHFEKRAFPLDKVSGGNAVWGDVDNDGDLDILATGHRYGDSRVAVTCLYLNGSGTFVKQTSNLPQLAFSHLSIGDANNDGKLDLVATGATTESDLLTARAYLYLNRAPVANTKPSVPTALQQVVDGQKVNLSWNPATDGQTPSSGLTYNAYLGTAPGLGDIQSGLSDPATGYRKAVKMGNTQHNPAWTIDNLAPGTYYWSVQSLDGSFAASPFSTEKSFTVQPSIPLIETFFPLSAQVGSYLTIKGKNFGTTSAVEINGYSSVFKVVNSTTIRALVPPANHTGHLRVTNQQGSAASAQTFCLIPSQPALTQGSTLVCRGIESYAVTEKQGVGYRWTVDIGGEIIENNNHQVKISWKGGGDYLVKVVPESCEKGPERSFTVHVKGPVLSEIKGSPVARTESEESSLVPYVHQQSYEWVLESGGDFTSDVSSNGIRIKWKQPGKHQLKLYTSNQECPGIKTEKILEVTVLLNAFRFDSSVPVGSTAGAAIADFDRDQDLDVLSTDGKVYENRGGMLFQPRAIGLPPVGKMKVLDFDNDNDADILLTTLVSGSNEIRLYENRGSFSFVEAWRSTEKFVSSEINFIDYDNDGDQDIFIVGDNTLVMYENAGLSNFQNTTTCSGYNAHQFEGASQVLDIDQDGFLDIATSKGGVFINTGVKTFNLKEIEYFQTYYAAYSGQYPTGLPEKNLLWEDVDNDGRVDLADFEGNTLTLHRATGNTFSPFYTGTLGNIKTVKFIDLNSDGWRDVVVGGDSTQICYYNTVTQTYTKWIQKFPEFTDVLAAFDGNGDGSIDLVFPKSSFESHAYHFFTNNFTNNIFPVHPGSLTSSVVGSSAVLSWAGSAAWK